MSGIDVAGLFRKFTVDEIKDIEKKVKGDIEKKKEDLRNMVGRRYRDIIEAADSIREMQNRAESILGSVKEVHSGFERLQVLQQRLAQAQNRATIMSANNSSVAGQAMANSKYQLDTELKFLIDLNELTWECIDGWQEPGSLLSGVWCLLLMEQIYNSLRLLIPAHAEDEDPFLTVKRKLLHLQGPRIKTIRSAIVESCHKSLSLQTLDLNQETVQDQLASCVLLESLSLEELLKRMLSVRKEDISRVFKDEELSSRERICESLSIFQTTLLNVYGAFCKGGSEVKSRITSRLEALYNPSRLWKPDSVSTYFGFQSKRFHLSLSTDIKNFHPTHRNEGGLLDLGEGMIQEICTVWIQEVLNLIRDNSSELMHYFETIESFSTLKKNILACLAPSFIDEQWDEACKAIIGTDLSLWDAVARDMLESRLAKMISSEVNSVFSELEAQSSSRGSDCSDEYRSNLLWDGSLTEVPNISALEEGHVSLLTLRARGIRPDTYKVCKAVDMKLDTVRRALEAYVNTVFEPPVSEVYTPMKKAVYSENPQHFIKALNSGCAEAVSRFCDGVKGNPAKLSDDGEIDLNSIVQKAEMCYCFCELSPSLRASLNWQEKAVDSKGGRRSQESELWRTAKTQLTSAASLIIRPWITNAVKIATESAFQNGSFSDFFQQSFLDEAQEWEDFAIEEETESGEKVSSKLKVPIQISRYLHRFLRALTDSIGSVGPHRFSKQSGQELLREALSALADGLHVMQDESMGQARAIQLLFDLRVLLSFVDGRNETLKEVASRLQCLIRKLEGEVDPFDLDVLTPHIRKNVTRIAQKLTSLYGVALGGEGSGSGGKNKGSGGGTENSQLLPIHTGLPRFQLLPAGSLAEHDGKKPLLHLQASATSAVLASMGHPRRDETGMAKSHSTANFATSLYDKFSSSWFGN